MPKLFGLIRKGDDNMHLKKLESVGFKSFAEKIHVDFVPGVTAVVGPNGSGKSNVTDAIRWVLGEQSAKSLRGTKMEDIIFQGSDTRKPLNMAEVTLTLDNRSGTLPLDYNEISVTRRVYRSGESEFYINKESCRLKDIVDLFLDSGLGREAFSIISQGKVEEILSSKAEERRVIFEEAAGVLKYKQRKKKAEFKLVETEENLNRVEDILHEINQQREPLLEQATVAKDYLAKKKALMTVEKSVLHTEIDRMLTEWRAQLAKIDQLKDHVIQAQLELDQKEQKNDDIHAQLDHIDEEVQSFQTSLLEVTETLEKQSGEQKLLLERERHAQASLDKIVEDKEKNEQALTDERKRRQSLETTYSTMLESVQDLKIKIAHMKEKLAVSVDDLDRQLADKKSDYIELLNEEARLKHARDSYEKDYHNLSNKELDFKAQVNDKKSLCAELNDELKELTQETAALGETLERQNKDVSALKSKLDEESARLQDMYDKRRHAERQIDQLESKKDMLEELKESFQGFYQGVKAVLKARDKNALTGIHGAVIELIDIPRDYQMAMESAMSAQSQHVIVSDEKAAREAIQYLKTHNQGRATFYPLTTIKPRVLPHVYKERLQHEPGFIAVASDVIHTSEPYRPVLQYLLGQTLIAKTLKDANSIATAVDRKFRVVTLDGDLVNPGGSMTGGAMKRQQSSLFSRETELKQVTEKLHAFVTRTDAYMDSIKAKEKAYQALKEELQSLEETMSEQKAHFNALEDVRKAKVLELKHQEESYHYNERLLQTFNDDQNQLKNKQEQSEEKLTKTKAQLDALKEAIDQLEEEKEHHEAYKKQYDQQWQQLKIDYAEQMKALEYQLEKLTAVKAREQELLETVQQLTDAYDLHKDEDKHQAAKQALAQTLKTLEEEKQTLLQTIQQKREQRLNLQTTLETKEAELKTERHQLTAKKEEQNRLEVKANRLDVELENRLNYLQETYEMSFERLQQETDKTETLAEDQMKVKLLKRDIDELGVVNLGAIDEYDRINERFEFLTNQEQDLLEAKETLYDVIFEMDTEMEKRFDETFSQIKSAFSEVFQQLFGGGHAELKLTNPDDLLETGVEIKAQPPGKKAQQLALLSGGERALTAIALLFSILRVRPVPFCVLDEVEAALDEANVERFSRYLKDYSQETQFIVITHRKGTMEGADVLYGVTMQESGVSRFVSVKLEETAAILNEA
ncbi:chromosome partition protein Smc [Halolactibacillus miurensis]|uniref:Chromosome partition protein Smc n=2 Tax=Halolactibacillus miurensis TaxID=306541 RepID=A0ABQ0VQM7_9BACI|nr:chromosome partition protein Smc [Halolactibacillus miurensis]